MCGIAGVLHDDPRAPASRALVQAMADRLIHRGPDAEGIYVDGPAGLGHRRLSIIDVAGGDQPIFNRDGTIAVVFNGEIYNHQELRRWLQAAGYAFKTRSDTEVLVHAYEHEGPGFVQRLRGMFAFALWDGRKKRLMVVRDRLGKKPLYWYHGNGRFLFASELKAILADREVDQALDLKAISDYLSFLCILAPRTVFQHVKKLQPAHYLLVQDGAVTEHSYWDLDLERLDGRSEAEIQAALVAELDDAVACRLESEVPLGAFLSGGVDSSSVVALMARHASGRVRTASVGFDVAAFDESDYAAQIARRYETEHHFERVQVGAAAEDELERLVWHLDEPFADPSAIPTARVSGIARKVVTVALSGDGGDEVFAGYRRYRVDLLTDRVRRALPGPLRRNVLGALGQVWPRGGTVPRPLRFGNALEELALDGPVAHYHSVSYFREPGKQRFFTADAQRALGDYSSFEMLARHYEHARSPDPLARMLYVDVKTYLPDRMLMKVDKMAMMHGLEVRSPFLDHHLVTFGLRLPARLKVRDGEGKWILKRAMEPYVPADILYRPKQGFDVPLAAWLRGPLAEPLEAAIDRLGRRGYLEPAPMRNLFEEHRAGIADHADRLWILYMLELWHRVYRIGA
jgi:asparagine synthase (glutamine-hydrolysing)